MEPEVDMITIPLETAREAKVAVARFHALMHNTLLDLRNLSDPTMIEALAEAKTKDMVNELGELVSRLECIPDV